jgi:hypothetical protein
MQANTEGGGFVLGRGARKPIECPAVFISNSVSQFSGRLNSGIAGNKFQFPIPAFNANIQTQPMGLM